MIAGQPFLFLRPAALPCALLIAAALLQACGSTSVSNVTAPAPVRCAAEITVQPTAVAADGGQLSVSVAAARDCTWSAQSEASWLQLASTSGQGTATINVNAASNAQAFSRTGSIVVNDQRLTVTQDGRGCAITLSGPSDVLAASGGSGTLSIATLAGCTWTLTSSAPWLVPASTSGSGPANVAYQVSSNPGGAREGTLAVGTRTFVVSQAPNPATLCTFSIDRGTQDFPAAGGSATVTVTTQGGCQWDVTGGAPWVKPDATSGTGSGSLRYTVDPNVAITARQATLTIAGRVHAVTQQAVVCSVSITPDSRTFTTAGGPGTIQVTTNFPVCPWSASSNAGWATITPPATGIGNGQVTYQVGTNTETNNRTATITVGGRTHLVQQSAVVPCSFTLDPETRTLPATASSSSVRINTQNGCNWTASSTVPWITVTGPTSGNSTTDIAYSVAANPATSDRTGIINAGGRQHTVTQQAAPPPCTYSLTPAQASFTPSGGNGTVRVNTQSGCAWTAVSNAGFVTIPDASRTGTGPFDIQYQVSSGPPNVNRTATITVNGQVHTITQRP